MFGVCLTAATLGACAQSSILTKTDALVATPRSRTQSLPAHRSASLATGRHVAAAPSKHTPFANRKPATETKLASYGLASFYGHASRTASGEKFDAHELTAAHRSLPFGTRVRVTNVSTGRSVTVRINDRGPFVPGRVVDVSHAAAETLGMTGQGVAKVKLDVLD
jgi:rare lipoprotein A